MTISLENQLPDLPAHPLFHKESTTAILPQTGMVQELLDPFQGPGVQQKSFGH